MLAPAMDARLHDTMEHLTRAFLAENASLNLSALRSFDQCWHGNVLDSLAFLDALPRLTVGRKEPLTILDLGTGGGFPLLPLSLALPDADCHGIDATTKKIDAVARIAEALNLQNVTLHAGRAEELGRDPALRERCDIVTARAVAPLATLLEYAAPFLAVGGVCVFWKSTRTAEEERGALRAMELLSLRPLPPHAYVLPGKWGERRLLLYEKTAPTDERYPRAVGVAKKTPL